AREVARPGQRHEVFELADEHGSMRWPGLVLGLSPWSSALSTATVAGMVSHVPSDILERNGTEIKGGQSIGFSVVGMPCYSGY
ncbi:MAG: hypothetical protein ACRD1T_19860, partial [Acidimicrobiia bacterium]